MAHWVYYCGNETCSRKGQDSGKGEGKSPSEFYRAKSPGPACGECFELLYWRRG